MLLVSCPEPQSQSTVTVILQYNGFFRNDIIFSPWNYDRITRTCFDDGICSRYPFSYLVSFPFHLVISPVFHLNINNIFMCNNLMVGII